MNPDLVFYLRSLTRMIYVVTDEEDLFITQFQKTLAKYNKRTWVFNAALGLVPIDQLTKDWQTRAHAEVRDCLGIHDAMIRIYQDDPKEEQNFYIITDPERWLRDEHVQRRVLNIAHQLHNNVKTVKILLFIGPRKFIPEKLARYMEVVHDRGMTPEEISEAVSEICARLKIQTPEDAPRIFRGLTHYEVNSAIAQSFIKTKKEGSGVRRVDPAYVAEFKRHQLRKTDLLQFVETTGATFDDVGGNARFKEWALETQAAWTDEGRAFGLKPPKGVLACGVWGCGKSLSVKAMGHAWKLPVVQMEMGRLRSSGVGESEANVYRAIRLIEAVSPCVTGDTHITLADGSTAPIEDLWEDGPEDLWVRAWNERTLRVESVKVLAVTRREAEAFRVSAANGYHLNATANHQHYVLRGEMPEWVRTDELVPGDMLAVPLDEGACQESCKRLHPEGMRVYQQEDTTEFRRGGGGWRDAVVPRLPESWSPQLGWLLGVIEGDGFIGRRGNVGLTNTSEVLLRAFKNTVADLFGVTATPRQHVLKETPNLPGLSADPVFQPCWTTVANNQLMAEFLTSARRAILTAPTQVRAAFLAGWLDADGCFSPSKVTLTVKSPKLRDERKRLARQIVQSLKVVPSKFESCNMEITGSRARRLAAIVGEHLVLKGDKARDVVSSDLSFDRGMGYACGGLLARARKASGVSIADVKAMGISVGVMWRHENGHTPISSRYMQKYVDFLHDPDMTRLLEAPCEWVEVIDVTSVGEHPVYDLACEGADTHSFFANGLVTHNCIVWIDEAEKSLSGNQSSGASDAGTTSRTIGILSTWMQETTAPVCLAMTANSISTLPLEFINRMDERFFFDLPSEDERMEILKIHLRKAGQDPSVYDLATLAEKASNMVGREIEQAIYAAMIKSFKAKKPTLDEGILLDVISKKPRIFRTMGDELKEILDWVGWDPDVDEGIRARFASGQRSESFRMVAGGK